MPKLRERFGEQVGALCIGPAGEMRLTAAVLATTDDTRRAAARRRPRRPRRRHGVEGHQGGRLRRHRALGPEEPFGQGPAPRRPGTSAPS
ncbi:MAG: hypothetical protein MZV63_60195 [Marinilabiliales bacterium]|nr:hypothetical protein [Marinilabiliales bacterium]